MQTMQYSGMEPMEGDWNSSYLFGDDEISGWGLRYFYSFYTELGNRSVASSLEVIVFIIIFALSVITNVTVAAAVLRYPEMRTVTNCFLLNLTVADLLFASGIPALVYSRLSQQWTLGNLLCKLLPYSQFVCGFVLLWTLTWISMDRHRCIVVPPFRSQLTPARATTLTAITWLVALVVFLPVAFWFREQRVQHDLKVCTLVFPRSQIFNTSLSFTIPTVLLTCVIPLTLFVYHYQRIFRKLKETRERWKTNRQKQIVCSHHGGFGGTIMNVSLSQHEDIRFNRHIRVIRVLLLNVLVVLVMWLPITVLTFLIYIDGRRPNEDTNFFLRSHHFIWALQIALLNTIVNPLLYGVLSEHFRKCFARMWFLSQRRKTVQREFYNDAGNVSNRTASFTKNQQPITSSVSIPES